MTTTVDTSSTVIFQDNNFLINKTGECASIEKELIKYITDTLGNPYATQPSSCPKQRWGHSARAQNVPLSYIVHAFCNVLKPLSTASTPTNVVVFSNVKVTLQTYKNAEQTFCLSFETSECASM